MLPSYKTNDPKGWCGDPKRGAAMGRAPVKGNSNFSGKLVLRRVRLDRGGYDENGTYFGLGNPLFWFASEDGTIDDVIRSPSREIAKVEIKNQYPNTRFFR